MNLRLTHATAVVGGKVACQNWGFPKIGEKQEDQKPSYLEMIQRGVLRLRTPLVKLGGGDPHHTGPPKVIKVPGWPKMKGFPFSAAATIDSLAFISLSEVVACEVSLTDMKDFAAVNKAYAEFWPSLPPSRVAVQVGKLARDASVEIRCLAAIPAGPKEDIQESAEAAGTGFDDVYEEDDCDDYDGDDNAYAEFWPSLPPSRVAVQARDASVEIRCLAAIPAGPKEEQVELVV
ncbi:RutC family protein [Symbiodinium microadriaticum]|uniref:RutC family protein n=1 Tax=Symbiodinium microadriaticum TaxID=2951 RepID=A0A1Q9DSZ6_SYMMI|nr:RutC family protein [Symbiodinium microadriaticum]